MFIELTWIDDENGFPVQRDGVELYVYSEITALIEFRYDYEEEDSYGPAFYTFSDEELCRYDTTINLISDEFGGERNCTLTDEERESLDNYLKDKVMDYFSNEATTEEIIENMSPN